MPLSQICFMLIVLYGAIVDFVSLYYALGLRRDWRQSLMVVTVTTAFVVLTYVVFPVPFLVEKIPAVSFYIIVMLYGFGGTLFQKIFALFATNVIIISSLILSAAFAELLFPYASSAYILANTVICFIFFTAYLVGVLGWSRKIYERLFAYTRAKVWALYSLGPIASFFAVRLVGFSKVEMPLPPVENYAILFVIVFFSFWSLFLLCFTIIRTHKNAAKDYELTFARQTLNAGRSYYENLTETLEQVRVLQHDYKHQLAVLSKLTYDGKHSKEALQHLESMVQHYEDSQTEHYCTNPVIDALLCYYAGRIRAVGVDFDACVNLPNEAAVDNYDLCVVLGNLLDNAMHAAEAVPQTDKRWVKLDIRYKSPQTVIRVSNSFYGEIQTDKQGSPQSMRSGGGNGTRSVHAVAEKYGGAHESEWNNGIFSAYVLLGK